MFQFENVLKFNHLKFVYFDFKFKIENLKLILCLSLSVFGAGAEPFLSRHDLAQVEPRRGPFRTESLNTTALRNKFAMQI